MENISNTLTLHTSASISEAASMSSHFSQNDVQGKQQKPVNISTHKDVVESIEQTASEDVSLEGSTQIHEAASLRSHFSQNKLHLPKRIKCKGRPKGEALTVIGKRKRTCGGQGQRAKKAKVSPDSEEQYLNMLIEKSLVAQVVDGTTKISEDMIECNPENVPNGIVKCPKENLRKFFDDDGWASFLNTVAVKEKTLDVCPSCGLSDDYSLCMVCCDSPGCERWYHFECVGLRSSDQPYVTLNGFVQNVCQCCNECVGVCCVRKR